MPKFKVRRDALFINGASMTGATVGGTSNQTNWSTAGRQTMAGTARVYREVSIPWTAFAAGSANTSGSSDAQTAASEIDAGTLSGSIPCLAFLNTTSACMVNAVIPFPTDAATTGSVTLLCDWGFAKTTASVARIGACVHYVQGGLAISNATPFAGSGVVNASATTSTACALTTSTICTLKSFSSSTTGMIVAKFWRDATSASDTSGSEFRLLGLRLRYVSDNLGPAVS